MPGGYKSQPTEYNPRNAELQKKGLTVIPRAMVDMFASALRGGVTGALGTPGDLERLVTLNKSQRLPSSEDVSAALPPVNEGQEPTAYEKIGEYLPTNAGKIGAKALPAMAAAANINLLRKGMPLTHSSSFRGGIPQELTHPSLMVASPKATGTIDHPLFSFGENLLIGKYDKFEPKTSPSVIKATDFFTPRRDVSFNTFSLSNKNKPSTPEQDTILDDMIEQWANASNNKEQKVIEDMYVKTLRNLGLQPTSRDIAEARLKDRYKSIGAKGAAFKEGDVVNEPIIDEPWKAAAMSAPRFQSFEHFAKDPKGAGRLLMERDSNYHPQQQSQLFNEYLYWLAKDRKITLPVTNKAGEVKQVSPFDEEVLTDPKTFSQLFNKDTWKGAKSDDLSMSPKIQDFYLNSLRTRRRNMLDMSPSQYAEVKRFGPTQVTGENFSHAIIDPRLHYQQANWLRQRGIEPIDYTEIGSGRTPLGNVAFDEGHPEGTDLMRAIANMQLLRGGANAK